jgi:hypothetical protein
MRESDYVQRTSRNTVRYHGSRVSILLNRGSAASVREASDTLPEGGTLLNYMLAGKPTGCVAGATVLVNFGWRQVCAKIECIYDTLPAVPTEAASRQNQSAPFTARGLTR